MTGFEPRTSGIGSDRSTNWATQPLPNKTVKARPSRSDYILKFVSKLFWVSSTFFSCFTSVTRKYFFFVLSNRKGLKLTTNYFQNLFLQTIPVCYQYLHHHQQHSPPWDHTLPLLQPILYHRRCHPLEASVQFTILWHHQVWTDQISLLKNRPTPASFSCIFGLFKQTMQFFTTNQC